MQYQINSTSLLCVSWKSNVLIDSTIKGSAWKGHQHLPSDHDEEDIAMFLGGVAAAGFISGIFSEIVSHYSSILETSTTTTPSILERVKETGRYKLNRITIARARIRMKQSYRNISNTYSQRFKSLSRPSIRSILFATVPSALGFLAWEVSLIINLDWADIQQSINPRMIFVSRWSCQLIIGTHYRQDMNQKI